MVVSRDWNSNGLNLTYIISPNWNEIDGFCGPRVRPKLRTVQRTVIMVQGSGKKGGVKKEENGANKGQKQTTANDKSDTNGVTGTETSKKDLSVGVKATQNGGPPSPRTGDKNKEEKSKELQSKDTNIQNGTLGPPKDAANETVKKESPTESAPKSPSSNGKAGGLGVKSKWGKLANGGKTSPQVPNGSQNDLKGKPSLLSRKSSLMVPDGNLPPAIARSASRLSVSSKLSLASRTSIDLNKLQNAKVVHPDDVEENKRKQVAQTNDSYIRNAIPYLPLWFAIICLVLNILLPGTGTILSGFGTFCCGRQRLVAADKTATSTETLCTNFWVGTAQLFTISFMLVGWLWSISWGVLMVIHALEKRRLLKQEEDEAIQATVLRAMGARNVRPSIFFTP
ncbi:unnamed protein product [Owenia fusiformis]|uniref:Uncharacterized protein n=1 Tax=Owenia fusiformis TaxID=6347 RepID=A0A8J1XWM0_OWEFU|nr:unnamed protein product [Owenia fusiformis]